MSISLVSNSKDISDFEAYTNAGYKEYSVDLEGLRLSRHGKINFIQVCVVKTCRVFLFDMSKVSPDEIRRALSPIFSDNSISKFMFDCRADADALYHQLNIKLSGVVDIQLFEIGFRKCTNGNAAYYHGLFKVLEENRYQIDVTSKDFDIKKKYKEQFKQEKLNVNLDDQEVLRFMAIDVIFLKNLYTHFNGRINNAKIRSNINAETKKRENYWTKAVYVDDKSKALSVI